MPDEPNKAYAVRDIALRVMDYGKFMEVHRDFAPNLVVGFARLNGRPIGFVANQPACLAGVLDINASMTQRIRPTLFALGTSSTLFSLLMIGLFVGIYTFLYRRTR